MSRDAWYVRTYSHPAYSSGGFGASSIFRDFHHKTQEYANIASTGFLSESFQLDSAQVELCELKLQRCSGSACKSAV